MFNRKSTLGLIVSSCLVLAIGMLQISWADDAEAHEKGHCLTVPSGIPAALAIPANECLAAEFLGTGVQIYTCTAAAWTLLAPEANLTDLHSHAYQGNHYLGPVWQQDPRSQGRFGCCAERVVGHPMAALERNGGDRSWTVRGHQARAAHQHCGRCGAGRSLRGRFTGSCRLHGELSLLSREVVENPASRADTSRRGLYGGVGPKGRQS